MPAQTRTEPRIATFDTLEQLDVLSTPFRVQLLEIFAEPATIKEAAARLSVPVTRLYYHVNLLVDHGFLEVAEERTVGSLIERLFVVTADGFRPSRKFMEHYGAEGRVEAIKLIFRTMEGGVENAAAHGLLDRMEEGSNTISLSQVRLNPARRTEFIERLNDLLREYDDRQGEPMWRLVAVLPRWVPGG
ncbi:MAG: helix-turn-helix domain-containing protein [Acidimicrobiia bacterium]